MENAITSQYFLEAYKDTTITISSTENQNGILSEDSRENIINSGLIGSQSVYKCSDFTGITSGRYVLFHDIDNNLLGMIKGTYDKEAGDNSGIRNNFTIQNQTTVYYKIEAQIEDQEFSGSTVNFDDLGTNELFKVYLNGKETTSYTRSTGQLVFDSGTYNTFGNTVYAIFYPASQSLSGVSVVLHYYSPHFHEVIDNSELLLGYQFSGTASVSAGSNEITTSVDLSSDLELYEEVRLGSEVKKVLYISGTTIKVDSDYEQTYSAEDFYRTPFKMFVAIENESENLNPTFYTFKTKGIKQPVKIKEEIDNKFTFDYFIDTEMLVDSCSLYNYITDDVENHLAESNRMRIIRAYYQNSEIDKFIYLTNIRKIESFNYTKSKDYDKYNASLDFEDKLTLDLNPEYLTGGILGAGGAGSYFLKRG